MWYRFSSGSAVIHYAESADGITWTQYTSNPLNPPGAGTRAHVIKIGSTYLMYVGYPTIASPISLYTSTDGVAWTLDTSDVLTVGVSGWDSEKLGNLFVWKESANDWRMIYEAAAENQPWSMGYATSTDGKTWTKYAGNPVLTGVGMHGGPWIKKVDTIYYMWAHYGGHNLPTDIGRWTSTDLITWTPDVSNPMFPRRTALEGVNTEVGQVADPFFLEINNVAYLFYSSSPNGASNGAGISLATNVNTVITGSKQDNTP